MPAPPSYPHPPTPPPQLLPANQERFRAAEGFELMLRCVHESGFARFGALRTLSHAVAGNAANCAAFVDAGGLKALFPAFMGKGECVLHWVGAAVLTSTCFSSFIRTPNHRLRVAETNPPLPLSPRLAPHQEAAWRGRGPHGGGNRLYNAGVAAAAAAGVGSFLSSTILLRICFFSIVWRSGGGQRKWRVTAATARRAQVCHGAGEGEGGRGRVVSGCMGGNLSLPFSLASISSVLSLISLLPPLIPLSRPLRWSA